MQKQPPCETADCAIAVSALTQMNVNSLTWSRMTYRATATFPQVLHDG